MGVTFANQSFGVFVGQLKEKFMGQKHVRHVFSKAERQTLFEKSDKICSCCGKVVGIKETQIDHLIPLASGGTNDEENLQRFCASRVTLRKPKKKQKRDMLNYLKLPRASTRRR